MKFPVIYSMFEKWHKWPPLMSNEAVFQNFMVRQHNSSQVGMKQNLYEEYIRSSETDRL